MHLFVIILFVFLTMGTPSWAQPKMSTEQLAAYNKPDREKMLYAGAKAEGKVTWYTSLAGDSYKKLAAAYKTFKADQAKSVEAKNLALLERLGP